MKNKQGFTLVELIAVITLISILMIVVVPKLSNLLAENREKQYTTYEDLMVSYTKAYPNYKAKTFICLEDLNMKNIAENIKCNGYVKISSNKITPYLRCTQNGEKVYETERYSTNRPTSCLNNA